MKRGVSPLVQKALLAFSSGAMIYVVIEELIHETNAAEHSNVSTVGFTAGFMMMVFTYHTDDIHVSPR